MPWRYLHQSSLVTVATLALNFKDFSRKLLTRPSGPGRSLEFVQIAKNAIKTHQSLVRVRMMHQLHHQLHGGR